MDLTFQVPMQYCSLHTKGTFHAKMGSIKDRNGMDLTEEEDIKKRCQAYTEELYQKDLHDPDNHDGVITHLESDILECEIGSGQTGDGKSECRHSLECRTELDWNG